MAITIYTNEDIKPVAIAGQRLPIVGSGSQVRAHAQHLLDTCPELLPCVPHARP